MDVLKAVIVAESHMYEESDRYKIFSNFMKNELGVTKEDIKIWTKEAIYEIAEAYVKDQFSKYSVDSRIAALINKGTWDGSTIHRDIVQQIAQGLQKRFDIKIVVKEPTNG
jgi:hypothetical protein